MKARRTLLLGTTVALALASTIVGMPGAVRAEDSNITIRTDPETEQIVVDKKAFCSTESEAAAEAMCKAWIEEQKQNLGKRVLTTSCSAGVFLFGRERQGCLAYLSEGELSFLLNPR